MPIATTPAELSQQSAAMRQCPFCGMKMSWDSDHCPYCREALPVMGRSLQPVPVNQRGSIRRGLLYMLLGAVIHYFAGGYSALTLPFPIVSVVTSYRSPVVFLGGLGLTLYSLYRQYAS